MATTREITFDDIATASVDRFEFTISKDGATWVGADSVEFTFESPDRATQFTRSATLELPDAGLWYYDSTVSDFTTPGDWTMGVTVTDGAVVKKYPFEIGFHVNDVP